MSGLEKELTIGDVIRQETRNGVYRIPPFVSLNQPVHEFAVVSADNGNGQMIVIVTDEGNMVRIYFDRH